MPNTIQRPMTKRQTKERRVAIISQLAEMSRDGWRNARLADYLPLEKELRELNAAESR